MSDTAENKKQAAGLGAIRPDKFEKDTFLELCEDKNLSQTKMFSRMLWAYLGEERKSKMEDAIAFQAELDLLDADIKNFFEHFKCIAEKAQNTIIAERSNHDQTIKNLQLELDTEKNENVGIEKRNNELEASNDAFQKVKEGLIKEIEELKENSKKLKEELQQSKLENADLLKLNRKIDKENQENVNTIRELHDKVNSLSDEAISLKNTIKAKDESIMYQEEKTKNLKKVIEDLKTDRAKEAEELKIMLTEKITLEKDKEVIKLNKEYNDLQKQFNELQIKNLELTGNINEKSVEVSQLNIEIKNKNDEISGMSKELNKAKKEIGEYEKLIEDITNDKNRKPGGKK